MEKKQTNWKNIIVLKWKLIELDNLITIIDEFIYLRRQTPDKLLDN